MLYLYLSFFSQCVLQLLLSSFEIFKFNWFTFNDKDLDRVECWIIKSLTFFSLKLTILWRLSTLSWSQIVKCSIIFSRFWSFEYKVCTKVSTFNKFSSNFTELSFCSFSKSPKILRCSPKSLCKVTIKASALFCTPLTWNIRFWSEELNASDTFLVKSCEAWLTFSLVVDSL